MMTDEDLAQDRSKTLEFIQEVKDAYKVKHPDEVPDSELLRYLEQMLVNFDTLQTHRFRFVITARQIREGVAVWLWDHAPSHILFNDFYVAIDDPDEALDYRMRWE